MRGACLRHAAEKKTRGTATFSRNAAEKQTCGTATFRATPPQPNHGTGTSPCDQNGDQKLIQN
jgi:hypothetical protein